MREAKSVAAFGLRAHSGWAVMVAVSGGSAVLRRRIEMTKGSGYRASRPYHAAGEMRLPQVSFQRMASPSRERCPFRASDIIHYRLLSGQPDGAYGFDATLKSWRKNARTLVRGLTQPWRN